MAFAGPLVRGSRHSALLTRPRGPSAVCRVAPRRVWPARTRVHAAQREGGSTPDLEEDAEEEIFVLEDADPLEGDQEVSYTELYLDVVAPATQKTPRVGDTGIKLSDVVLVALIVALVYLLVSTCASVMSGPYAGLAIETNLKILPMYTALSMTRMLLGYLVSLVFSLAYAYVAYRVPLAAKLLMLIIDVLQSIPLFSFMPGVVLGLMALFPGARVGVELAAIFLLFTSMAWNMVLAFYQSLCGIPRDLQEAAEVFGLSNWKRFWVLELPAGAVGLIWNSIISVAGGWFFLISIESFELGNRNFRLPGLGSFLAAAAEVGNYQAIFSGLMAVILVIVATDFLIWRPLIAWSSRFTFNTTMSGSQPRSSVGSFLRRSSLIRNIQKGFIKPAWDAFVDTKLFAKPPAPVLQPTNLGEADESIGSTSFAMFLAKRSWALTRVLFYGAMFGGLGLLLLKSSSLLSSLALSEWARLARAALYTFGRVGAALMLSLIWTIPAGVAIGRDPKIANIFQPIVQIAASVPATALFPFLLLALSRIGGGLQIGSIALMMLGTMWYILFNVIAGTQAIPSELFDVDSIYGQGSSLTRWRKLILPGIFPYLITGVVTAVGGAWNASIVSEYVVFQGGILKAQGLGCIISEAAASGNYPLLMAGTVVMSVLVFLTNRFVWNPLYKLAQEKYRIL